jgi:hypothetical protein
MVHDGASRNQRRLTETIDVDSQTAGACRFVARGLTEAGRRLERSRRRLVRRGDCRPPIQLGGAHYDRLQLQRPKRRSDKVCHCKLRASADELCLFLAGLLGQMRPMRPHHQSYS